MKCCFRCGHYFTHKSNLNRHLNKKLPCKSNYLTTTGREILNDFIYYKNQFEKLTEGGDTIMKPLETIGDNIGDLKSIEVPKIIREPIKVETSDSEIEDLEILNINL